MPIAEILKILEPEIEKTILDLATKKFRVDPLAGEKYSKIASVLSSAYKRHGFILERALLETVSEHPDLEVWDDDEFCVSNAADHMVDSIIEKPEDAFFTELPYGSKHRTLQVDLVTFNNVTHHASSYEIKRGNGLHDAGKKRSILRDLLCQQILLKSYAASRGLAAKSASVHIVFYYGQCSIKKPFSLVSDELDGHFGCSVVASVEAVNNSFRLKLQDMLKA